MTRVLKGRKKENANKIFLLICEWTQWQCTVHELLQTLIKSDEWWPKKFNYRLDCNSSWHLFLTLFLPACMLIRWKLYFSFGYVYRILKRFQKKSAICTRLCGRSPRRPWSRWPLIEEHSLTRVSPLTSTLQSPTMESWQACTSTPGSWYVLPGIGVNFSWCSQFSSARAA